MTFVWIFLWVMVAVGVLGYLGWSANIAMAQKSAWTTFGNKYKMEITPGAKFLSPPALSGLIQGRKMHVYVTIEQGINERLERVYTHVEVMLNNPPRFMAVLSKKPMPVSMTEFRLDQTYAMPELKVAQTDDLAAMAQWMNPARVSTIKNFMAGSNAPDTETIFISSGDQAFLLWRTEDPMRDPKKLNALAQKLFTFAKELDAADAGMMAKPNSPSESVPPSTPA